MRLGGTNSATHFSSRPLWIEVGSPIEGPLQRSEHVIVIGYCWEFVRVSRRVQQRQVTGLLSGGAGTWGGAQKGPDS
jgi:hypothetical protein